MNARGRLVGVMSDLASYEKTTGKNSGPLDAAGCGTPAKYVAEMLENLVDLSRPVPYKVCPKCECRELKWTHVDDVDVDDDGVAYSYQVEVVACPKCGWEIAVE